MASNGSKNMEPMPLLNYYLTMNIKNICRICLETSDKLTSIFDPIKSPHFSILIMACANVQVHEADGLPPSICQRCISRLNIAFQFKTQCETSDDKLRQCFQNCSLTEASDFLVLKTEKEEENDTNQNQHNTNSKEAEIPNEIVQGEAEMAQNMHRIHGEVQNGIEFVNETHSELFIKEENYITENEHIQDYNIELSQDYDGEYDNIEIGDNSDVNISDIISDNEERTRNPSTKIHKCDICGKEFKSRSRLVDHKRIHTGERPYICHLCQKGFVMAAHLRTHMRTHTGEKNHICVACNKAFGTKQHLDNHTIAIHTSERPDACTYCPKKDRKRKRSELWKFFVPLNDNIATCNMCKLKLSYKTSTSNLKKHLENKHPTVTIILNTLKSGNTNMDTNNQEVNAINDHIKTNVNEVPTSSSQNKPQDSEADNASGTSKNQTVGLPVPVT